MAKSQYLYPAIIDKIGKGGGGGQPIDAYTKTESDARYAQKNNVYDKTQSDTRYVSKTDFDNLKGQVDDNIVDIGNKANSNDVYTKLQADGRYGKKEGGNEFVGTQVFKNNTGPQVVIRPNTGDYGAYIEIKDQRNARKGYIGKPSGTNNDMEFKNDSANANIKLTTTGNGKVLYNNQEVATVANVPNLQDYLLKTDASATYVPFRKAGDIDIITTGGLLKSNGRQVATAADIPNMNNYYTKTEADGKYIDNTSNQTIRGVKKFGNKFEVGDNFEIIPENDVLRLAPKSANKWLHLSRAGGADFAGVDFKGRTKILNVPNPIEGHEAANKQYVDNATANSVRTNVENTFTANQKINNAKLELRNNDEAFKLGNSSTNNACYVGLYNGNTRMGFFGKERANSNNLSFVNETSNADILLQTKGNGKIRINNVEVATVNSLNGVKLKQVEIKRAINSNTDIITGLGPNKKIANIEVYRQSSVGDQWYSKRPADTYRLFRFPDKITFGPSLETGFSNNWWIIITYFEY